MQPFPGQNVRAAIEFWQLCTAVAILLILFVSSQLKTVRTRERDVKPFLWILTASLVASVVGPVATTIWTRHIPSMQSIEAAALYMLAQVVQLHQLWPCTPSTNEEETKQAWNGHVCAWVAMASWDMLAIIKLFVAPLLSTQELVADAAIVGLQCCLIAALFVIFAWPVSRRIRLPDAEVAIPPAGVTRRVRSPLLQSSVADEIQMAGGLWQWFKSFHVFRDWIWPRDMPWIWVYIAAALLLLLSETGLTLYRPHIQGAFFNSLAESRNGEPLRKVWKLLLELTIVTLLTSRTGLSSVRKLLWQKFKLRREQLARTRIFEHLMNHEASFHDTADTADVNGATAAGAGVCDAFDFLVLRAVPELITLVGTAVAVCSLYGPHVAFIQGFVIILNMLVTLREGRTLLPLHDAQIKDRQGIERRRLSALRYWRTVAAHGRIDSEIIAYATGIDTLIQQSWWIFLLDTLFSLASGHLATLGRLAATALVVSQGLQAGGAVGLVVTFWNYWDLLQGPLQFFINAPQRVMKDLYKADRLRRLLEKKSNMVYGENELLLTEGRVKLRGITFSYPGTEPKPVFQDLDLVLQPGKTTAVVGASGVGKSTLLGIIARFYDPLAGSVEIDGQDLKTLKRGELARHIGYMGQTPQIFNDTIKENIRYGRPDATDADVREAAERAGLHSDIMAMGSQYNTIAGEDGKVLSGGQKQRLVLARTILQNPKVLLLDEPTSAQDANTEARFKKALDEASNCTRLIVTHRLSSILHADQIVVMQKVDGVAQIAETGTHNELVAQGGVHATFWENYTGG